MRIRSIARRSCGAALALAAALFAAPSAQATTLTFEDSGVTSLASVDATSYFASYGITLVDPSPFGSTYKIYDLAGLVGTSGITPTSGTHYFDQEPSAFGPTSMTLVLPGAGASEVSVSRVGVSGGSIISDVTVTYYEGDTILGTSHTPSVFGVHAPVLLSFEADAGHAITSVVISSAGLQIAATGPQLDDFSFTPIPTGPTEVPEPATLALLAIGALPIVRRARRG